MTKLQYIGKDPRHDRIAGIPASDLEVDYDDKDRERLIACGLYEPVDSFAGTFYRRRPVDADEDPDDLVGKRWIVDGRTAAAAVDGGAASAGDGGADEGDQPSAGPPTQEGI